MKMFHDLNETLQKKAIDHAMQKLVMNIAEGVIVFDSNSPQGRKMNAKVKEARSVFSDDSGRVYDLYRAVDQALADDLHPYAVAAAMETKYIEDHEYAIELSSLE